MSGRQHAGRGFESRLRLFRSVSVKSVMDGNIHTLMCSYINYFIIKEEY